MINQLERVLVWSCMVKRPPWAITVQELDGFIDRAGARIVGMTPGDLKRFAMAEKRAERKAAVVCSCCLADRFANPEGVCTRSQGRVVIQGE